MELHITHLDLSGFRNYREASLDFHPRINCFVGDNAAGKTNLLDALYYLSFTKSFFQASDHDNILHGEEYFMINGLFRRNGQDEQISCAIKKDERKILRRNKKEYQRMSDHIGLIPLVIVSPYDTNLISSQSEERRKFINHIISQYDKSYLEDVINYNKVLKQRNTLLKDERNKGKIDRFTLDIYDHQLSALAGTIYQKRKIFTEKLLPVFAKYHSEICQHREVVSLSYYSQLHESSCEELLKNSFEKDRAVQYTTCGIHKDDLIMQINGYPVKTHGSQGQQKTFMLALKLAQFDFLKELTQLPPLLLLDDIFDKLDKNRVNHLVEMVAEEHFGQIFITDTSRDRIERILPGKNFDYFIYQVENGKAWK